MSAVSNPYVFNIIGNYDCHSDIQERKVVKIYEITEKPEKLNIIVENGYVKDNKIYLYEQEQEYYKIYPGSCTYDPPTSEEGIEFRKAIGYGNEEDLNREISFKFEIKIGDVWIKIPCIDQGGALSSTMNTKSIRFSDSDSDYTISTNSYCFTKNSKEYKKFIESLTNYK